MTQLLIRCDGCDGKGYLKVPTDHSDGGVISPANAPCLRCGLSQWDPNVPVGHWLVDAPWIVVHFYRYHQTSEFLHSLNGKHNAN